MKWSCPLDHSYRVRGESLLNIGCFHNFYPRANTARVTRDSLDYVDWMPHATVLLTASYISVSVASLCLSISDARTLRLPNRLILFFTALTVVFFTVAAWQSEMWDSLIRATTAAVALFLVCTLIALMRPTQLGGGDVKLSFLIGFVLGWHGWAELFAGVLLQAILLFGVVVALSHLQNQRSIRRIPLAPIAFASMWLAIGTVPAFTAFAVTFGS